MKHIGEASTLKALAIGGLMSAVLVGCPGPPDDIGKTTRIVWRTTGPISLCAGDTYRLGVTKTVADSARNEWKSVDTSYNLILLRTMDSGIVAIAPGQRIRGLKPGTTSVSAEDTVDGLSLPWREVTVTTCP